MYALILAGGFATRLWPVTRDFPKPLLPLGKKRIIEFTLEKIDRLQCIGKIYISTNRAFEKYFKDWFASSNCLKDKSRYQLIIEPSIREDAKFGAIRGIHYDLKRILRNSPARDTLIVAGDNIASIDFESFLAFYRRVRNPVVAVFEVNSLEAMKGLAEVHLDENNKIIDFIEKPKEPKSRLAATAIYVLPKDMTHLIGKYLKERRNPDAPGYFFEWLSKRYDVYAYKFDGYWFDIGSLEGYLLALNKLLSESYVNPDAQIEGKIINPVYIEVNAKVDSKSVVGPYAIIGANTIVSGSEIRNSLIMSGSIVNSSSIRNSIIGNNAQITGGRIHGSILSSYTRLCLS
ncbi:MAG: NDP-sugar synthase [Candidatus Korarchaeota archaeon]|nr:NDP-sugar synthase [Thermoproteota archaeon]MCR8463450.1 NDP-sugar synthase [Thermoproteota archaeon]MCR8471035.1 NDP-sugar synthase [Thermoproteota archaeon]MCR8472458.1 NDP-sugar synthase [Thermoproteota archaeon]MCR8473478.1 NDP-sugar synthase [Thermoproteota archaeon]